MRLVEEQQPRIACERNRQREPSLLAGREPAMHDFGDASELELLERGVGRRGGGARRARREVQVLARRQVVVAERLVADERHRSPHRAPVTGQVVAEHRRGSRTQREQPGEEAQERRFAGAVGA